MRSFLFLALIFSAILGVAHWYNETKGICPVPITYRLGQVDENFRVERAEILKTLSQAEVYWENTAQRDLFIYDETSTFVIDFIYDERQQLARTEEEWRLSLDKKEAAHKELLEQLKQRISDYEEIEAKYQAERVSYEARLTLYNEEVEKYNDLGGAPSEVYAKLQAEQKELAGLANRWLLQEKDLNKIVTQVNEFSEKGNKAIEEYNADVNKYNEIYGNRDLYTQGDFKRDRINIYKFSDQEELAKVVAHEFGHALGLTHVEGESSIMYYLMAEQPSSATLSNEDRQAFAEVCGDGTGLSYEIRRLIRITLAKL